MVSLVEGSQKKSAEFAESGRFSNRSQSGVQGGPRLRGANASVLSMMPDERWLSHRRAIAAMCGRAAVQSEMARGGASNAPRLEGVLTSLQQARLRLSRTRRHRGA